MEVLGASASAVGIAALAVEGATKLYQAFNAYRDGPHDVQELLDSLDELQASLRFFSGVVQRSSIDMPTYYTTAIERSLDCSEKSLLRLAGKLDKCNARAQDGTLRWLASRLRPVICRADFEKMRQTVLRHKIAISAHTSLINAFKAGGTHQMIQVVDRRLGQVLSQQTSQNDMLTDLHATLSLSGSRMVVQATLASFPTWFGEQLQVLERRWDLSFDSLLQPLSPLVMRRYAPLHGPKFVENIFTISGFKTCTDPGLLLEKFIKSIEVIQGVRMALRAFSEMGIVAKPRYIWREEIDIFGHSTLLHHSFETGMAKMPLKQRLMTSPMPVELTEDPIGTCQQFVLVTNLVMDALNDVGRLIRDRVQQ
ncbi:hypothetical protein PRZ48_004186 [Zasmidium cellare]|uniref:Fungal N-terminal domain-containing protein n=1 Tax=Zasmidium cellare TaxID=395010 RepID=A0ABR0EX55_ZASCE|nr:hypothetical protein PRZ48_004186 [Zasmidium cellare]